MDRFDRIFELNKILKHRRTPISRKSLQKKLECSRSTVGRTIEDTRDILGALIKYNRQLNSYQYDIDGQNVFELPGLWFNASEIFALLTTNHLLSEVQPGLLEPHIEPLKKRLDQLLRDKRSGSAEIAKRIKILQMAPRPIDGDTFRKISHVLVSREKIKMLYHGRAKDKTTERWVSPQRLVYYRDNWYLDAWCHLRKGLRNFSLDRVHIIYLGEKAKDIEEKKLNKHFGDAYGIFAGEAKNKAVIRFSSQAARWVADEHWHSDQLTKHLPDGGIELTIPYTDPRELIMDILKYGADAKVIHPKALRKEIHQRLRDALHLYRSEK